MGKWKVIGAATVACAACCAPLFLPLIASIGAGVGGAALGGAAGTSIAEIACAAIFAAIGAGTVFWLVRARYRRSRGKAACDCAASDTGSSCAVGGSCNPKIVG